MKKRPHPLKRRLVVSPEAVATETQHRKPCADCPFARTALKGWLAGQDTDYWLRKAHSDAYMDCHCTTNQQCAGAAIFRENVLKRVRDPRALSLPQDAKLVFASDAEFIEHHEEDAQNSKPPPKKREPKPGHTICPNCAAEYLTGAMHFMFCPACTCDDCGTTFSHVIEMDAEDRRVCEQCRINEEEP